MLWTICSTDVGVDDEHDSALASLQSDRQLLSLSAFILEHHGGSQVLFNRLNAFRHDREAMKDEDPALPPRLT